MKIIKLFGILGSSINLFFIVDVGISYYNYLKRSQGLDHFFSGLRVFVILAVLQILAIAGVILISRVRQLSLVFIWLSTILTTLIALLAIFSIGLYLFFGTSFLWVATILSKRLKVQLS